MVTRSNPIYTRAGVAAQKARIWLNALPVTPNIARYCFIFIHKCTCTVVEGYWKQRGCILSLRFPVLYLSLSLPLPLDCAATLGRCTAAANLQEGETRLFSETAETLERRS